MKDHSDSYKRYVLASLLLISILNFVDRQVLAILMEPIKKDLGVSDTQLGFLSGIAFAIFYTTCGIPIARLADRRNRVTIIAIALALWSAMTALCGLAGNFVQLVLARIGVGVGEAGCSPPSQSVISDYFGREQRGRAMAVFMLGVPLGVMAGYLVGGWINELYGWRAAFLMLGLPGVALAVVFRLTVREPTRGGTDGVAVTEQPQIAIKQVLASLWQLRSFRYLVAASTTSAFVSYGVGQWLPSFLIRSFGMNTGELGTWMALTTGIGGAIGMYLGGQLADRFGQADPRVQVQASAIAMGLAVPFTLGVVLWPAKLPALILMIPPTILTYLNFGPTYALVQSLVDVRMRATAAAVMLMIVNLIGLGLGPQIVGILSDSLRPSFGEASLRYALASGIFVYFLSAFFFWQAGRTLKNDLRLGSAEPSPTLASG